MQPVILAFAIEGKQHRRRKKELILLIFYKTASLSPAKSLLHPEHHPSEHRLAPQRFYPTSSV
jgi:hypothetical protein